MKDRLTEARANALEWLLNSGIRNASGPLAGAFNAWHDGTWGWAYSEVTGYGVTLLCGLHVRDACPGALDAALAGARWLTDNARVGPAYRCRYESGAGWLDHLCSFDNGMILNGFCNLHRATGDRAWLDAATATADWLLAEMALASGGFVAKRDVEGRVPDLPGRWSTRTAPYQAKIAQGLANLARSTGVARYADAAKALCRWAVEGCDGDGRFVTDPVAGDTYLHAHVYAAEGLLSAASMLGDPALAAPALPAARWLRTAINPSGGLSCRFDGHGPDAAEQSDSTAQALRLLLLTGAAPELVPGLAARLLEFQCRDADPRRHGGFRYGRTGDVLTSNVTAHGTLFAVQAIDLCLRGPDGFDFALLV